MTGRQVITRQQIAAGLAELGIGPGNVVLGHASLRSFGFVVGGVQSLYLALCDVLGSAGTLAMPSFTPQLCHPSTWRAADLAGSDLDEVARGMPPFDVLRTPAARSIGALSEMLRAVPESLRSNHPHVSFVAKGSHDADITRRHPPEYRLSAHSPLGVFWELNATVLMLGTGWSTCTALHLAEYAAPYPGRRVGLWQLPTAGADGAHWHEVPELLIWEGDFDKLGSAYELSGGAVTTARVGDAVCRAVRLRPLIRFATRWLLDHRDLRRGIAPPGWREVVDAAGPLPVPALPEAVPPAVPSASPR
ncbi:MAG: AAC(3) family N-acetyltransferase [Streptomycetaceae bacterium]|nr:AAC(3) family N-acetyltransferase [Streptomycetaceae bacterium]